MMVATWHYASVKTHDTLEYKTLTLISANFKKWFTRSSYPKGECELWQNNLTIKEDGGSVLTKVILEMSIG